MPSDDAAALYDAILAALEADDEGVGYDVVWPNERLDYPMARAQVVLAESRRDIEAAEERVRRNADWLCAHADRDDDGVVGWGLPFEWDTGISGVTYDQHQETAITTAICIDGLLAAHERLNGQSEYLTTAVEAAETFVSGECYTIYDDGICFWYTDSGAAESDTINSHAYLIGQIQRLTAYDIGEDQQRELGSIADRGVEYLLSNRREEHDEYGWLWNHYGRALPADRPDHAPQDILHTAYTVDGLVTYSQSGGSYADRIDTSKLVDSFQNYRSGTQFSRYVGTELRWLRLFPRYLGHQLKSRLQRETPKSLTEYREPLRARLWGLGHSLAVASQAGRKELSEALISELVQSRGGLSRQREEPRKRGAGAVRHLTHVLNGLSQFQNS